MMVARKKTGIARNRLLSFVKCLIFNVSIVYSQGHTWFVLRFVDSSRVEQKMVVEFLKIHTHALWLTSVNSAAYRLHEQKKSKQLFYQFNK